MPRWGLLIILAAFSAACTQPAPYGGDAAQKTGAAGTAEAGSAACPDDGARLPETGICQGQVAAYFGGGAARPTDLQPGCSLVGAEVMLPGGDEAILFNTMTCNGKATKLDFAGGARSAALTVAQSAVFDGDQGNREVVRIFRTAEVADPKKMILDMARGTTTNKAEAAACAVRAVSRTEAAEKSFPDDALVVDVSDAYKRAKQLNDQDSYAVCGDWGLDTGAQVFWLIRGGYAMFVDLGQDLPDFDPSTLTVVRKGTDGAWSAVD